MSDPTNARIQTIREFFRRIDAKDPSLLDLVTNDVDLFFPKHGVARGKAALARFGERIAQEAPELTHAIEDLVFTVEGHRIAVEGRVTAEGREWPNDKISPRRFASVFEFDGPLICRTYIYVDPYFTRQERLRIALDRDGQVTLSPREVAERYLEDVSNFWAAPDAPEALATILDLFAEDVDWDIPGDLETVSWIGPRRGRKALGAFYRELAFRIEPRRFEVRRIVADEETAVILGELTSLVKATDKLIESPFVFDLTVRQGRITRFRMLEDSHAVARAAA